MITANARRPSARWVVTCTLTNVSALHIGGGPGDTVDALVRRDRAEPERPLIPGTTLAGILRSNLADRLAGFGQPEPPEVALLFGASRASEDPQFSVLSIADAIGFPVVIEVRDGVAIDAESGTAADHAKFDYEVVPAGSTFVCAFELLIRRPKGTQPDEEQQLAALAVETLCALDDGISLGGRVTRGLGRMKASEWRAKRFDLTSADGWNEWLRRDPSAEPAGPVFASVIEAVAATAFEPATVETPKWQRLVVDVELEAVDETFIRSAGTGAYSPDQRMLVSAGKPTHTGTSLAGPLRARARRIAHLANKSELVTKLFGPEPNTTLSASPLRVSEHHIVDAGFVRVDRVRIERLTHGTVPGALFDEEIIEGGTLKVHIELRNPHPETTGLLIACLKDLCTGELPTGGTAGVGRGRWVGNCALTTVEGMSHHFSGRPDASETSVATVAWLDSQLAALFEGAS